MQVSLNSAALREARAELAEARKQWHSLQVEIETLHALVRKPLIMISPQATPKRQTNTLSTMNHSMVDYNRFSLRTGHIVASVVYVLGYIHSRVTLAVQEKGLETSLQNTQQVYSS